MKVRYQMEDSAIIKQISQEYGILADHLNSIPMGDQGYSYKVNCVDGGSFYMKLFDNHLHKNNIEQLKHYLGLTRELFDRGLFTNLTYPIPNRAGQFKTSLGPASFVL